MPVAFLFNRRLVGADDKSLADALSEYNYAMVSPCYQLYIMERDFDVGQGLKADSSVGIIVADVQANPDAAVSSFPQRIAHLHAVLTVVHEARLPAVEGMSDVVSTPWGDAKRMVLESLLECARLRSTGGSKSTKKHAGLAQNVLRREISALSSSSSSQRPSVLSVEPPLQRVSQFLETLRAGEVWPDVASWLVYRPLSASIYTALPPVGRILWQICFLYCVVN